VLQLIDYARHVVGLMTGNSHFTTPTPALTTVSADATNLETAQSLVKHGTPALTADRNTKKVILHDALSQLASYVEGIANADPMNALTIAKSSGFDLKADPTPRQNGFRIKALTVAGQVELRTTAVPRSSYIWQYTATPNDDASWKTQQGNIAKMIITGLISGQRIYFRVAVVGKTQGPWSNLLSVIIP
jgi:hypothetical protein